MLRAILRALEYGERRHCYCHMSFKTERWLYILPGPGWRVASLLLWERKRYSDVGKQYLEYSAYYTMDAALCHNGNFVLMLFLEREWPSSTEISAVAEPECELSGQPIAHSEAIQGGICQYLFPFGNWYSRVFGLSYSDWTLCNSQDVLQHAVFQNYLAIREPVIGNEDSTQLTFRTIAYSC